MRDAFVHCSIIFIGLVVFSGCPAKGDPIGETCSPDTLCDDLCLLDIPNGMCSKDCSEGGCPDGYVCGDISGGRYCLVACSEDGDCRDGMICAVGGCSDPRAFGAECEEAANCAGGACHEGRCNLDCRGDCPEDLACVVLEEGPRCVEHSAPGEVHPDGPYESPCTFEDCESGFRCLARTENAVDDPYAYCTTDCATELDCPLSMTCRESQTFGEDEPVRRCVTRDFCETCAYDSQCRTAQDLCVREDPLRGDGLYCSEVCELDRASTCPTDSSCREAFYCDPDRTWVADCSWCSDADACGAADGRSVFQCFKDYGACRGTGEDYCAPCHINSDCPEGGYCAFDRYEQNRFCTAPCTTVEDCGIGHACYESSSLGHNICAPRSGSCSVPSGGVTTCYGCDDDRDCLSGYCLPSNPASPSSPSVCWEDCGLYDCPAYTLCYTGLTLYGGAIHADLCFAPDGLNCAEVQICGEECPEGPSSCGPEARSYCR